MKQTKTNKIIVLILMSVLLLLSIIVAVAQTFQLEPVKTISAQLHYSRFFLLSTSVLYLLSGILLFFRKTHIWSLIVLFILIGIHFANKLFNVNFGISKSIEEVVYLVLLIIIYLFNYPKQISNR